MYVQGLCSRGSSPVHCPMILCRVNNNGTVVCSVAVDLYTVFFDSFYWPLRFLLVIAIVVATVCIPLIVIAILLAFAAQTVFPRDF